MTDESSAAVTVTEFCSEKAAERADHRLDDRNLNTAFIQAFLEEASRTCKAIGSASDGAPVYDRAELDQLWERFEDKWQRFVSNGDDSQ